MIYNQLTFTQRKQISKLFNKWFDMYVDIFNQMPSMTFSNLLWNEAVRLGSK